MTAIRVDDTAWIQTYTGRAIYPLSPDPKDIYPADIAHGLAMKCRFQGQCLPFYSVAQHSVLVAEIIAMSVDPSPELQLAALLHDAAEAYLPDIPRPIKQRISEWDGIETNMQRAIAKRFGFDFELMHTWQVKAADDTALATEFRDIMAKPKHGRDISLRLAPYAKPIKPVDWEIAERRFRLQLASSQGQIQGAKK